LISGGPGREKGYDFAASASRKATRSLCSIAVMLTEVQTRIAERHAHVERQLRLEAGLPLQGEAEEAEIRGFRRRFVEHPQDGRDGHSTAPFGRSLGHASPKFRFDCRQTPSE
jgi:hypothetical protein